MKHTERCATWGSDNIARKETHIGNALWTWNNIGKPSMKDYGYWEFDTKEQLLNTCHAALLAADVGRLLSELQRDKVEGGDQ